MCLITCFAFTTHKDSIKLQNSCNINEIQISQLYIVLKCQNDNTLQGI